MSAPPGNCCFIAAEFLVLSNDTQFFFNRLCNDDPVKRVVMMMRQVSIYENVARRAPRQVTELMKIFKFWHSNANRRAMQYW
jgi:hypothetical protein